jgi:type I restriction enzyme S subunit
MSWRHIPLRHAARVIVSNVDKKTVDGQVPVRLVNYTDVYYGDTITADDDLMVATASLEQADRFRVRAGDTLITKDSETPEDIAVPAYVGRAEPDMVCGYHLALIRPNDQYHPRFLYWAMASVPVREQASNTANGMTRYGITLGGIQSLSVPLPPLEVQRRIADFLDDQTTRIDRIITARQQQIDLIDLQVKSWAAVHYSSNARVPIRRLVREAVVGIVVKPADWYTTDEDGIPALRGTDINEFEVANGGHVRITPEGHAQHPRSVLSTGDVVVVRTGDAGSASVVPSWAANWNAIDLVIVRPSSEVLPDYLALCINAARWGTHIGAASSGSIQQHFGVEALLNLPVPAMDERRQKNLVDDFEIIRRESLAGRARLQESTRLLRELKQSMIGAAVAGEFDVSAADGSQVVVRHDCG